MGFMDKAKKLAEQAQAKADEVQKQFSERQGASGVGQPSGPVVQYDQHGRPIGETAAPPPPPAPASPGSPPPPAAPAASTPESAPAGPPAPPPSGGLQQPDREDTAPPKLSSGDPLAG